MSAKFTYSAESLSISDTLNQLQEALAMAGMVSLRDDLSVVIGDCWSFNSESHTISIPMNELVSCPRDRIRWIILHEAAHAALTRYHDFLPAKYRERGDVMLLLNVIEDVRIERWLTRRFPGSVGWQGVTHSFDELQKPVPRDPSEHPAKDFIFGILDLGRYGQPDAGINPVATAALEEARPFLMEAFECIPPVESTGLESGEEIYPRHPVSQYYTAQDDLCFPSLFEKWVRIMSGAAWAHILNGVLPVYRRLVKEHGAIQVHPVGDDGSRTNRAGSRPSSTGSTQSLRTQFASLGNGPYLDAVRRHSDTIEKTHQVLSHLLPNHRGLRHVRRCATGDRLDLRMVFQYEADLRLYTQLWLRRRKRTLPDPAFVFAVDRSSSMEGTSAQAAFEAMVMMREACKRIGIPFSILEFNEAASVLEPWGFMDNTRAEGMLGTLLNAESGTSVLNVLSLAHTQLEQRSERDRVLFLLTDGEIMDSEVAGVREQLCRFKRGGMTVAALGIGGETAQLRELFPKAAVLAEARELPQALSESLLEAIRDKGAAQGAKN